MARTIMRLGLIVVFLAGCGDAFQGPCGDGELDPFEDCDDGNLRAGDRCSPNCTREPTCGDGYVDSGFGENCDDGNTTPGDNCDENCRAETVCGDLDIEPGETCEDGNTNPSDGCSADCQIEYKVSTRVSWSFATAAEPGADLGCVAGFDTIELSTQALFDDDTPVRPPSFETVACDEEYVDIRRYRGRYRVQMRVTDTTGTPTYAISGARPLDLDLAVQSWIETIIVDGGVARASWRLIDSATGQPYSCADAGVLDVGWIASSPTFTRSGWAFCEAGRLTTVPLAAGEYTFTLTLVDEAGEEAQRASRPITIVAPNSVVELGTIDLSI